MVVGYPPFYSEEPKTTCQKIIHWKKTFTIPKDANLTSPCADLIRKLMSDQSERLGINGVEEIKTHPFFVGIDWKKLREKKPPFTPDLSKLTANFDKFEEEEPWPVSKENLNSAATNKRARKGAHFLGYTFKRNLEN